MYGLGILKSMSVTLRRFLRTYRDGGRYSGSQPRPEGLSGRQSLPSRGIFTVQYPQEKLPLPERFRTFPFHVLDPETDRPRCRACGLCARVCPPQCIWIVRATDPETSRPLHEAAEFHVDVGICMSCGLCAEFCPFDAIKMDHEYEVADYQRSFLWGMERLAKPLEYHAEIHPTDYAGEQAG